jgi:hypothetical protein
MNGKTIRRLAVVKWRSRKWQPGNLVYVSLGTIRYTPREFSVIYLAEGWQLSTCHSPRSLARVRRDARSEVVA